MPAEAFSETQPSLEAKKRLLRRRGEGKMNKAIRILLVHDHEVIRQGLRSMLELEKEEVVGECASAEEAFYKIERLCPDIVLMRTLMSGMNAIEATRSLTKIGYRGDVILLAESDDYRTQALEAGAASYLLEDATPAELADAIRQVFWSKHSPEEFLEDAVELVVAPANPAQILRFMCQLEKRIHNYDYADIVHTAGSWNSGTVITILVQSERLSSVMDELGNMPEVEEVEEQPAARYNKFCLLPRLGISPSKRVRVILQETAPGVA